MLLPRQQLAQARQQPAAGERPLASGQGGWAGQPPVTAPARTRALFQWGGLAGMQNTPPATRGPGLDPVLALGPSPL